MNTDAAREAARATDGKFGSQEHSRPERGLAGSDLRRARRVEIETQIEGLRQELDANTVSLIREVGAEVHPNAEWLVVTPRDDGRMAGMVTQDSDLRVLDEVDAYDPSDPRVGELEDYVNSLDRNGPWTEHAEYANKTLYDWRINLKGQQ